MNNAQVVLVDGEDREIGRAEMIDAHYCPGLLHRAISILLYRETDNGLELLITKRSDKKTRWPRFWTNPVCTHPLPDEEYVAACIRRLKEELGIRVRKKNFHFLYRFQYAASYDGTLCENELDSVFILKRQGKLYANPDEVSEYKWLNIDELKKEMSKNPSIYTPWFQMIMNRNELRDFLDSSGTL